MRVILKLRRLMLCFLLSGCGYFLHDQSGLGNKNGESDQWSQLLRALFEAVRTFVLSSRVEAMAWGIRSCLILGIQLPLWNLFGSKHLQSLSHLYPYFFFMSSIWCLLNHIAYVLPLLFPMAPGFQDLQSMPLESPLHRLSREICERRVKGNPSLPAGNFLAASFLDHCLVPFLFFQ